MSLQNVEGNNTLHGGNTQHENLNIKHLLEVLAKSQKQG